MTIALTGTGGLFTRLGRIGKMAQLVNTHQAALVTPFEDLFLQYDGTTPPGGRTLAAPVIAIRPVVVPNQGAWLPFLQNMAVQTVGLMVKNDAPSRAGSMIDAMNEIIRQMIAAGASVLASTVAASVTAGSANLGDGVLTTSTLRPDGLANELAIPETARVTATSTTLATFSGGVSNLADVWAYDWGSGSGASKVVPVNTLTSGTVLAGGGFDVYTVANVPDSWIIEVGTAGTQVLEETSVVYDGDASLKLPGNATQACLSQTVGRSLRPLTAYVVTLWVRTSGVPAAGVLSVEYTDSAGTVINDANGAANAGTVSLPGLTANTWIPKSFVFRTGRAVVATDEIRVRLSTALSVGTNLYIDRMVMAPMTYAYPGGPAVGLVGGTVPFAPADYWTVAVTNDRGGASYNATFQALFDRLFGMRAMGLVLPSSGAPTIDDTLITS